MYTYLYKCIHTGTVTIRSGKTGKIIITTETRLGNKIVTTIIGLEYYITATTTTTSTTTTNSSNSSSSSSSSSSSMDSIIKAFKKKFACSVSLGEVLGQKDKPEIVIQVDIVCIYVVYIYV